MEVEQIKAQVIIVKIKNRIQLKKGNIEYNSTYTVFGSGDIYVQNSFSTEDELPPLARVGVKIKMPAEFTNFTWYGRGPFESYEDRKESAKIALYSGKVADQYFPYVMPQENGNKTDVRWMLLSSDNGVGLLAAGAPLLNVNVQDFSSGALNRSKTSHQLDRGENIFLHLDFKQMGLGGDDSWSPRVHPEYLLRAKHYTYAFRLRPVSNSSDVNDILKLRLPQF